MNTRYARVPGYNLMFAVAGVAALTALAIADPATNPLFPPCPWRAVTGWLCPGCGSARAIHALMHGHVGAALYANPLAVAAVPLAAADLVRRLRGDEGVVTCHIRPVCIHALAVAIVLFGVLRNVSF